MRKETLDFDRSWKMLLDIFFEPFMAFFFPAAHENIDWNRKFEFLDKEFQQILKAAKLGTRIVDKLVRVWLKNGKETWILVHIEIQSQRQKNFEQRMYLYNTLIYQRHKQPVATLVILCDENKNWKPSKFGYTILGYNLKVEFPSVKILDYAKLWDELQKSKNPFAIAVMAILKTIETKRDTRSRLHWKYEISKSLLKRGFSKEYIDTFFLFIKIIMKLPEELEEDFIHEIYEYKDEKIMAKTLLPYPKELITIAKKEGLKEGLEQGALKATQEMIIEILIERFGIVSDSVKKAIKSISDAGKTNYLFKTSMRAGSIKEFEENLFS